MTRSTVCGGKGREVEIYPFKWLNNYLCSNKNRILLNLINSSINPKVSRFLVRLHLVFDFRNIVFI